MHREGKRQQHIAAVYMPAKECVQLAAERGGSPVLLLFILRFVAPCCVVTRPAQARGRVRKSSVWELRAEESGLRAVGAPRSTVTSEAGRWP